MSTTGEEKKIRQMPKGGRKGGTSFPRVALSEALGYAKKLVSKTHSGPQPQDVVFAGVVGAKSGTGQVRIAAMKQYGLLKGDAKAQYSAEELAKKIGSAPPDELPPLLQQAALRPAVFKKIFDAFQGDLVTKAKLRQRAGDLNVHPEETGTCVDLYVSSMSTAGLVEVDGENVKHVAPGSLKTVVSETSTQEDAPADESDETTGEDPDAKSVSTADKVNGKADAGTSRAAPRAVFHVNVNLDSSLDTDKLEKQLQLLKRYGAL